MKIYASRGAGSGLTIGQLYDLISIPSKTQAKILDYSDRNNPEVIWDGYIADGLKKYPELENAPVLKFSPTGSYRLSIHTIADFDYTPAW